jgi:hypothetical protein
MVIEIPARWLGLYSGIDSNGVVYPDGHGNPPLTAPIQGSDATWEFVAWTEERGNRIATYREQH